MNKSVLSHTKKWVDLAIASPKLYGRALCPFAGGPVKSNPSKLQISISTATNEAELLNEVINELEIILPKPSAFGGNVNENACNFDDHANKDRPETTLLVVPNQFKNDYRKMIHFSWKIMSFISDNKHLYQQAQVVNFHPQALHNLMNMGSLPDPADYTIRSPYPTFHFLREIDIMKAVTSNYPGVDSIPTRNALLLREMGIENVLKKYETLSK